MQYSLTFAATLFMSCTLAIAQPASMPMAQGLAPEAAAKAMTVPEGFSVTLFAGEPDVVQPIAMAFDDRGRLWVAEAYSYPVRRPDAEAKDRILIFEDVDGDGKFDKRTIFIDKLNLISGLEVGFDGVWVGAAPYLLFIPDKNHDDVPDGQPQILLDGWGHQDTHETLNSFIWGPDGWLYGCHGVFTHSNVGKPGCKPEERTKINAGVWRYHPVTHKFELFAEGGSNQWGLDFNDQGQAFMTACVIPHLYHVIQGGRYQRQAGQHFNPFTYDDIKTIAKHRHFVGGQWTAADREQSNAVGGGHAHAGAMIYLGGAWPEKYHNQIFMHNIHGARINQDALTRKGSGYEGDAAPDFLFANDAWSQGIALRTGPDGQVYMIDWYDKNQCHAGNVNSHDRSNGRIFKIRYGKSDRVRFNLKFLSDQELITLQKKPNQWWGRSARRLLQKRAADGSLDPKLVEFKSSVDIKIRREGLYALLGSEFINASWQTTLNTVWTLHVIGALNDETALPLLDGRNEHVTAWLIQLLCETGDPSEAVLSKFLELAKNDKSPVVRLYLASALQRLPLEKRWEIAEALIGHVEDKDDHNLPLMYWYAIEPLIGSDTKRGAALVTKTQIPLLRQYIVRRATAPAPELGKGGKVDGALEGEALRIISKSGGNTTQQNMASFTADQWSDATHLWWTGAKPGHKLTLAIPAEKDGDYEITAAFTKAPDYAIVQLHLNGKKIGDPIDLYDPKVITTGILSLGKHTLKKGDNELTLEITGANNKAKKSHMVGIDFVKIQAK